MSYLRERIVSERKVTHISKDHRSVSVGGQLSGGRVDADPAHRFIKERGKTTFSTADVKDGAAESRSDHVVNIFRSRPGSPSLRIGVVVGG